MSVMYAIHPNVKFYRVGPTYYLQNALTYIQTENTIITVSYFTFTVVHQVKNFFFNPSVLKKAEAYFDTEAK